MKDRPLLYRVRNSRGTEKNFIIPLSWGTSFTRVCIEHGVAIIGIGEPQAPCTTHPDPETALAEWAGEAEPA